MRTGVLAASLLIASCNVAPAGTDAATDATMDVFDAPPADATDSPPLDAVNTTDTWANFAQGFFATYCVSCHGPTTADTARDYTQLAQVQRDMALIRCGVTPVSLPDCASSGIHPRQFPIGTGPHPSDADRTRIVDWIAAGAM